MLDREADRRAFLHNLADLFQAGPQGDADLLELSEVQMHAVIAAVWRYVARRDSSSILAGPTTLRAFACAVEDSSLIWDGKCHFIAGPLQMATIVLALREQADALATPFEARIGIAA